MDVCSELPLVLCSEFRNSWRLMRCDGASRAKRAWRPAHQKPSDQSGHSCTRCAGLHWASRSCAQADASLMPPWRRWSAASAPTSREGGRARAPAISPLVDSHSFLTDVFTCGETRLDKRRFDCSACAKWTQAGGRRGQRHAGVLTALGLLQVGASEGTGGRAEVLCSARGRLRQ